MVDGTLANQSGQSGQGGGNPSTNVNSRNKGGDNSDIIFDGRRGGFNTNAPPGQFRNIIASRSNIDMEGALSIMNKFSFLGSDVACP